MPAFILQVEPCVTVGSESVTALLQYVRATFGLTRSRSIDALTQRYYWVDCRKKGPRCMNSDHSRPTISLYIEACV